jgi:hypothetical protein
MSFFERAVHEVLTTTMYDTGTSPTHLAVLFSRKTILQVRTNLPRSKHAEECIMKTAHEWHRKKRLRLYVTKINGSHRMSRPCWACSKQLKRVIGLRVFYTDKSGAWTEDTLLDNHHLSMRDFHNYIHPYNPIAHNPSRAVLRSNNVNAENFRGYLERMRT